MVAYHRMSRNLIFELRLKFIQAEQKLLDTENPCYGCLEETAACYIYDCYY